MSYEVLYPDEMNEQVTRKSSIDQFKGYLSVMEKGGWAPIVFEQLDGITCGKIQSHPIIISLTNDIGYVFPEARCSYTSDKFIYLDKEGIEYKILPECFGGSGEMFEQYVRKNTFVNFDNDTSLGTHNKIQLRTGLSMVLAEENLPHAD